MKKLFFLLSIVSASSAFANCSMEEAKVSAANYIEGEFGGGPIDTLQAPSMLAYNRDGSIKVLLASNVKLKSGTKRLMLSAVNVNPLDCTVKFEAVGLTDKKEF